MKKKTKAKKRSPNSPDDTTIAPSPRQALAAALLADAPDLVFALQVLENEIAMASSVVMLPMIVHGSKKAADAKRLEAMAKMGALRVARDKIARQYAADSASQVLAVRSINLRSRAFDR